MEFDWNGVEGLGDHFSEYMRRPCSKSASVVFDCMLTQKKLIPTRTKILHNLCFSILGA